MSTPQINKDAGYRGKTKMEMQTSEEIEDRGHASSVAQQVKHRIEDMDLPARLEHLRGQSRQAMEASADWVKSNRTLTTLFAVAVGLVVWRLFRAQKSEA